MARPSSRRTSNSGSSTPWPPRRTPSCGSRTRTYSWRRRPSSAKLRRSGQAVRLVTATTAGLAQPPMLRPRMTRSTSCGPRYRYRSRKRTRRRRWCCRLGRLSTVAQGLRHPPRAGQLLPLWGPRWKGRLCHAHRDQVLHRDPHREASRRASSRGESRRRSSTSTACHRSWRTSMLRSKSLGCRRWTSWARRPGMSSSRGSGSSPRMRTRSVWPWTSRWRSGSRPQRPCRIIM